MKTYKKVETVEKPRLVISYDGFSRSPRDIDFQNLGYFITVDSRYESPDKNETLEKIVKETGQEAGNQAEHIEMIETAVNVATGEKVLEVYPVTKYEHGGVSYSLGTKKGFDSSNNGFYIVTDKSVKELGAKKKAWESIIKEELKTYTYWVNGEVYLVQLFDENGEMTESCGELYGFEAVEQGLPAEFKGEDLTSYIEN